MAALTIDDYLKYSNLQMANPTLYTRTPNPTIHRTLRDDAAQRL